MLKPIPSRPIEFYRAIPKVELHRHLEGSLRVKTLVEVGRAHGMDLLGTNALRPLVEVGEHEPFTFENFLSKFSTLRLFYRSPDVISRITREAIADAAADNVRYMELRFTPVALSRAEGFSLAEVMDWVIEGTHNGEEEYGVITRLIASVNRHESPKFAEEVIALAADRLDKGVVGVDMAGNEVDFPAQPFTGIFREAKQAGLHVTIHAGEWSGASNVVEAIDQLGAERIGHGVRVMEDPSAVDLALERGTVFEVCVTSNYQSGVVSSLHDHPLLSMISAGLDATINTDDPSISRITLTDEYRVACEELKLPLGILRERVLAAAQATFLPENERVRLIKELTFEYGSMMKW